MENEIDDRYEKIARIAKELSECKIKLLKVRTLLTTKNFSLGERLVIEYDDNSKNSMSRALYGLGYDRIAQEKMELATPILGAVETALREQIRKLENQLRKLGMSI